MLICTRDRLGPQLHMLEAKASVRQASEILTFAKLAAYGPFRNVRRRVGEFTSRSFRFSFGAAAGPPASSKRFPLGASVCSAVRHRRAEASTLRR